MAATGHKDGEPAALSGQVAIGAAESSARIDSSLLDGEDVEAPVRLDRLEPFLATATVGAALSVWLDVSRDKLASWPRDAIFDRIARDIATLDSLLGDQLDEILHHQAFQALEASWRGLAFLASQAGRFANISLGRELKLRVINLSWREVVTDLERAIEFDQSYLFNKLYSQEFGSPGGEPYGLLLADFNVAHRPNPGHPTDDIAALEDLSRIAAASFSPIVLNADPRLFELENFSELGNMPTSTGVGSLARLFDQPHYIRWRRFRESADARFLGLVLPKVLMRLPYVWDGSRGDQFPYRENVAGPDNRNYLWGGAVYALGAVAIRAFDESNWLANLQGVERGYETGGLVTGLPVESFGTDRDGVAYKYSTDLLISDRQEQILNELGLIPLCHCWDTEWSAFYSTPSVQSPQEFDRTVAATNARMSASLQYMLSASRFAHYLKVIGRDKIGSFATPSECERFLQRWLLEYTVESDDESSEVKAKSPLREARVEVRAQPGRPGSYSCVVHLRPHYQVDQAVTAVTLVTELAAAPLGRE